MKTLFYITITALVFTFMSCAKDDASNPNSPIAPSTDSRDALVGTWNATENSTSSTTPNTYVVTIAKHSSNSSAVVIDNFYGLNTYTVSATVSGSSFVIPYQSIKNNTNSTIGFASGSGTLITSTKINITYTTSISGNRDSCQTVYTK